VITFKVKIIPNILIILYLHHKTKGKEIAEFGKKKYYCPIKIGGCKLSSINLASVLKPAYYNNNIVVISIFPQIGF